MSVSQLQRVAGKPQLVRIISHITIYTFKNTIGKKQIAKITKADCQRIINEMVQNGKKHSTMSNLKSCLNIVFECALDDDIIIKNPAKNLQIPRTESKKRTAIEQQQIDLFMDYVKNSERYSYSYPAFCS